MEISGNINFYSNDTPFSLTDQLGIADWIRSCITDEKREVGELSFVFCSPEKHVEINRDFLGHDYHTDVITFDYSEQEPSDEEQRVPSRNIEELKYLNGDIFIDPVMVAQNAKEYGETEEREMLRVLIHGVLHLCGYDDKTQKEITNMRSREDFYLAQFYK